MNREALTSGSHYSENDRDNLCQLLRDFGSEMSLKDIASTYCDAGRDLHSTAKNLYFMQKQAAESDLTESQNSNPASFEENSYNYRENSHNAKQNLKKSSVSLGTVSGIIGKDYIKPRPQSNCLTEKLKPPKINSDDFPISEIWGERNELGPSSLTKSLESNVEEFLCEMLEDGFKLEKNVVQNVIGQCGYDISKTLDKLFDLSAATLEKNDDIFGVAAGNVMPPPWNHCNPQFTKISFDQESLSLRTKSPDTDLTTSREKTIERELLEAMFKVSARGDEKQVLPPPRQNLRPSYGHVVTEPLDEKIVEDFTFITRNPVNRRNNKENEDDYEALRKAAMEYWNITKEYYQAGADALTKKDFEFAKQLMEKGNFFMKKAREADEKSAQRSIEDSNDGEEFFVDMHQLEPKEALRHVKLQLTTWSGLQLYRYMKVVAGINIEDNRDRHRKRLITRLLEKEGIPWTEEGDGWTLTIRVDTIDLKKLSLANK